MLRFWKTDQAFCCSLETWSVWKNGEISASTSVSTAIGYQFFQAMTWGHHEEVCQCLVREHRIGLYRKEGTLELQKGTQSQYQVHVIWCVQIYVYPSGIYIYIIINYIYRREGAIKQVCWDPPWGFASHLLVYLCMLGTPILWAAMGCHNHPKLNKTDKGINGISFCLPHDPLPFAIQNEACILPRSKNQDNHLGQDSRLPVPSMGH